MKRFCVLVVGVVLLVSCGWVVGQGPDEGRVVVVSPPPAAQCRVGGGTEYVYYDNRNGGTTVYFYQPATRWPGYPYEIYYPYCPGRPGGQQIVTVEKGEIRVYIVP